MCWVGEHNNGCRADGKQLYLNFVTGDVENIYEFCVQFLEI